jgi:hypothetical protein
MDVIKSNLRLMGGSGKTAMQRELEAYEEVLENMTDVELARERQRCEKEFAASNKQFAALLKKAAGKRERNAAPRRKRA